MSIQKGLKLPAYIKQSNYILGIIKLLFLGSTVILSYQHDLRETVSLALSKDEYSYILTVPVIFILLLYKKRRIFSFPYKNSLTTNIIGLLTCFLALMTYIWGSFTFYALQFHLLSLPIFLSGATLLLFGPQVLRALSFPIFLSLFFTPFPMLLAPIGEQLILTTTNTSYSVLNFLGIPIEISTKLGIILTTFTNQGEKISFLIGLPCSGLYSLLGFTFFATIFAYITSGSPTRKTLLATLGLILVYSLNILRVILIVIIGHSYGYSAAINFFHIFGGPTILFIGVLIWLLLGEKALRISILKTKTTNPCPNCQQNQNICHNCGQILKLPKINIPWKSLTTAILALIILTYLISQASTINYPQTNQKESNPPILNTSTGEVNGVFPIINGWTPTFAGRDEQVEKRLDLNTVALYMFSNQIEEGNIIAIFEVAETQSKLHYWEGCLYYQPFEVQIEKKVFTTLYQNENSLITGEIFTLNIPSQKRNLVLLYWFDVLLLEIDGEPAKMNTKTTLIAYLENFSNKMSESLAETTNEISNILTKLGQEIAKYWDSQEIRVTPTNIIMDFYNHTEIITVTTITMLIVTLLFIALKRRRQILTNSKKLERASYPDKILLKHILKGGFNKSLILNMFEKETKLKISPLFLKKKIKKFIKEGFLDEAIAIKDDRLYLTFRPKIAS